MIADALHTLTVAATGLTLVVAAVVALTVPQFTAPRRRRLAFGGAW